MIDLLGENWINILKEFRNAKVTKESIGDHEWPIAIFTAGPFKIAYPDFICGQENPNINYITSSITTAKKMGADIIRFQGGPLPEETKHYRTMHQGTVKIRNLRNWMEHPTEKARRTKNKTVKTPIKIRRGTREDGKTIYQMYLNTIKRHHGNIRYSEKYFTALSPEAAWIATIDDQPCAFVCVGFQNNRGIYMHGGYEIWAKKYYPTDLLYLFMLTTAYEKNMLSFDFLPSPSSQPSLTQYKKSWGAEDSSFEVTDILLTPLKGRGFIFITSMINLISSKKKSIITKIQALRSK